MITFCTVFLKEISTLLTQEIIVHIVPKLYHITNLRFLFVT